MTRQDAIRLMSDDRLRAARRRLDEVEADSEPHSQAVRDYLDLLCSLGVLESTGTSGGVPTFRKLPHTDMVLSVWNSAGDN